MIRRTGIGLAALSLVLAIAITAWWARSLWVMDSVYFERLGYGCQVTSVRGRLIVAIMPPKWNTRTIHRGAYTLVAGRTFSSSEVLDRHEGTTFKAGPFFWGSVDASLPGGAGLVDARGWRWAGLPHAAIAALCFAPAALVLGQARRRRRRRQRGLCAACGYDLRASTGRCPECGAPTDALPGPGATG